MRRSLIVVAVLALALVGIAAAHTNDVEADPQVSTDGEVFVESGLLLDAGYAVLHLPNESGLPGEPIGHVPVESATYYDNLSVPVDPDVWADWNGSRRVWITLHRNLGASGFDPAEDPVYTGGFGGIAGEAITLRKAEADWRVLAERFDAQTTDDGTIGIREVVLGSAGTLLIQSYDGRPGAIVGSTTLPAGRHRNVTVAVDREAFAGGERTVELFAALYGPDGETPVTAGNETVGSVFRVRPADALKTATATRTTAGTGETTGSTTTTDRSAVVTPTTERPLVITPTPQTTTASSSGGSDETTAVSTASPPSGETTATGDGAGFTAVGALVVVGALSVLLARRRR